jgi:prepilin-type processing-associated H-X9-DG protein
VIGFVNSNRLRSTPAGFTRADASIILAVSIALLIIVGVQFGNARNRARSICCNCNLKQVGLAFKTWALDHGDHNPMILSETNGGTMEALGTGEVFIHFQVMSNELSTPKVLICPSDRRNPSISFTTNFANSNLSYFVGACADETNPQLFLSGDRNLTGGLAVAKNLVALSTNQPAGWNHEFHGARGNVALADGSVQQFNSSNLCRYMYISGSNLLAMPNL